MADVTPMTLTYRYLRSLDHTFDKAESYNAYSKRKKDLFSIFDIVSMSKDNKIIGVQVCKRDWNPHVKKILATQAGLHWLQCGGEILLIGWIPHGRVWVNRLRWFKTSDYVHHMIDSTRKDLDLPENIMKDIENF